VPKLTAPHKWLKCKEDLEDLKDEMRQCVTTVEGVDLVSTARVTPHRRRSTMMMFQRFSAESDRRSRRFS